MTKLFTAIVYTTEKQPVTDNEFLKYRNIKNSEQALQKFYAFAAKFPGAWYVNLYDKHTRAFVKRHYFKTLQQVKDENKKSPGRNQATNQN